MPVVLPEPDFSTQTEESLRARMLDAMPETLDRAQGSFAWTFISPVAIELAQMYAQLDLAVQLGFVQTAYGKFLDARAEEFGVFRLAATKATGQVTFSGSDGTVIPAGTLVGTTVAPGSADQSVVFVTDSVASISGGSATVGVTAQKAALAGNVPIGAIDRMVNFVSGVSSVSNAAATEGGTDEETDDAFRTRFLAFVAARKGAGTVADYETWALEVAGVGFARGEALWSGAGTVRVLIADSAGQPASAQLQQDVTDYIETLRPIGASVTVATITVVTVTVDATLVVETGFTVAGVTSAVEASVQAYFDTLEIGDDVILTEVGAAIVTTQGVADYSGLQLDAVAANKAIAATERAEMGVVTLT